MAAAETTGKILPPLIENRKEPIDLIRHFSKRARARVQVARGKILFNSQPLENLASFGTMAYASCNNLIGPESRDIVPLKVYSTTAHGTQTRNCVQKGRLSRTIWANQRDDLASKNVNANAV